MRVPVWLEEPLERVAGQCHITASGGVRVGGQDAILDTVIRGYCSGNQYTQIEAKNNCAFFAEPSCYQGIWLLALDSPHLSPPPTAFIFMPFLSSTFYSFSARTMRSFCFFEIHVESFLSGRTHEASRVLWHLFNWEMLKMCSFVQRQ